MSLLHVCIFCGILSCEKQIKEVTVLIEKTKIENEDYRNKIINLQTFKRIEKVAKFLGFTQKAIPRQVRDSAFAMR